MTQATIVVEYGDSVDSSSQTVKVELDDTLNLDDDGEAKTNFVPGDMPYFLVHCDATLEITRVASTDGQVVSMGNVSRDREEEILFTVGTDDDGEATQLSYTPAGAVSVEWSGQEGNGFSVADGAASIASNAPCLAKVSYPVSFAAYQLIPPVLSLAEDESYTIYIVVYVEAAA